ncbi:hypothetical protein Cgig2_026601 [Carnegiea gigantea]|uniref:Reverse transcriptase zinc-binding domain-containing protein n=1 Tax=Carnegiea gigantea TaxID=171969 RepID=A0A9Q1KJH9_9CARY|nr:hypothetical protein Cgig2_026601 [Carnegiea gigantea]
MLVKKSRSLKNYSLLSAHPKPNSRLEEKRGNFMVAEGLLGLPQVWRCKCEMVPFPNQYETSEKFNLRPSWLPRPTSFKPISLRPSPDSPSRVSELIDHDHVCWCEPLVNNLFMLSDAEIILRTPLCDAWLSDSLKCDVLPRVRLFSWRACRGTLPSALNISKQVPSFSMNCTVCGHAEETDVHAILDSPLAAII